MSVYHTSVLLRESIDMLGINPDGIFVDLTYGGGGHSAAILAKLGCNGRIYGFDQDPDAKANRLDDDRITLIESNFRFLRSQLRIRNVEQVDGILADLGVSSHHFDTPERGFSFRFDAPLDMRMNSRAGMTAQDILNEYSEEELTQILGEYGEMEAPYKAANCIVKARARKPLERISDLIGAIAPVTPRKDVNKYLSRLFQALRIEVNGEIEALKMMLGQSLKVLKPQGRLVVISYHSLEDRLVKNFMRSGNFEGNIEKDFYGHTSVPFELIVRKAVIPSEEELKTNTRSRSAKLRGAIKIGV